MLSTKSGSRRILKLVTEQENDVATIKVQGMKCQHCAGSTKKALEGIDGISNARVDLDKGEVTFDGSADMDAIKAAVSKAGFQVVDGQ